MEFFRQQAAARRRSGVLVALFVAAVLSIVAAIDLIVLAAGGPRPAEAPLPLPLLIGTSLAVLAVIALASLYRIAMLSSGGAVVARELGATPLPAHGDDARVRRLRNVVEEVAIAAGTPVPQIFVLTREPGINAFAAGFSSADAAITVTGGALDKLSRDELQGVIAHEFSHIVNGDMRLNIRLMGLLFGILVLAVIGQRVLIFGPRGGGRDNRGSVILLVALALLVLGYIGVFFGRLIKAAASRSRERLADAAAVQFTRQSAGLAGALKKILGLTTGSRLVNSHGEEVSHMLFADGLGLSSLFATHPPLVQRIRLLEPGFDPRAIQSQAASWNAPGYRAPDAGPSPLSPAPVAAVATAPVAGLAASIGRPQPQHYPHARDLLARVPPSLAGAARDPGRAVDLVLGLLLDRTAAIRQAQLEQIAAQWGNERRAAAAALVPALDALHPALRLPLASVALPALRTLEPQAQRRLQMTIEALIKADARITTFEYALGHLLRLQLEDGLHPAQAAAVGRLPLARVGAAAAALLAVLAEQGQTQASDAAAAAFAAGAIRLGLDLPYSKASVGAGWTEVLDAALSSLDGLTPADKARLIDAACAAIATDGRISVPEAELLRVVCASLHCPLPPLLAAADPV
ncbi:MAG: M48 family metallopeptidase [Gammaproteobacteria bacterium]|nr:M48 family metallopeptidase [Gammaproteobacteria bacterium]